MTGLQAGGISPSGAHPPGLPGGDPLAAQRYEKIYISGGQRGVDIRLPVQDLARLTKARFGRISRD